MQLRVIELRVMELRVMELRVDAEKYYNPVTLAMATNILCQEVLAATAVEHATVARLIPRVQQPNRLQNSNLYQLNVVLGCSSTLEIYEVLGYLLCVYFVFRVSSFHCNFAASLAPR